MNNSNQNDSGEILDIIREGDEGDEAALLIEPADRRFRTASRRTLSPRELKLLERLRARRKELHEMRLGAVLRVVNFLYRHKSENPVAERVRFLPNIRGLMLADQCAWMNMGMIRREALMMSKLMDFSRKAELSRFTEKPKLATLSMASPYMAICFHGMRVERFFLLCLNRTGNLKKKVCLSIGTSDAALYSVTDLLIAIIREQPAAIILAHNHPGGTLMPSNEDLMRTRHILRALLVVGVPLLDHLVVARSNVVSIRDNGFIPEYQWNQVCPNHPMMRRWLDENTVTGSIRAEAKRAAQRARSAKRKKNAAGKSRSAKAGTAAKNKKASAAAKTTATAKPTKTTARTKSAKTTNPPKTE